MDDKTTGIVSYLTIIGWVIALLARKNKNEYTAFHLRQYLGIIVLGIVFNLLFSFLPSNLYFISLAVTLLLFVLWIIGLVGAFKEEQKLVPVVGEHFQKWFSFIN